MRYVIYGAGGIGGVIGGWLHHAGREVVLIARGAHHEAIRERGLRIDHPQGTITVPTPVVDHPSRLDWRGDEVVFLTMKTQDTLPALNDLAAAVGALDVPIVCAQNAVENERLALRLFPRVYGLCVMLPATYLDPGVVWSHGEPVHGILDLGRYPEGADDVAALVAADLEAAGFRSQADPRIMRQKYSKLVTNLINAVDAACGPAGRESVLLKRARAEALEVLAAAGIDVASPAEDAARRGEFRIRSADGQKHRGSSAWQSLARGLGTIETNYFNGEIVLLGRLHGVPTPVNALLQRVAAELARTGAPPGSRTPEQLEAMLEGAPASPRGADG
ncbi:MAG: ketopantoate reductase family protein [Acidimicrobiales bacterium]